MYVIQIIVEYFMPVMVFVRKFNVERNNPYNVLIARGISFYIDENGNKNLLISGLEMQMKKCIKTKKKVVKI